MASILKSKYFLYPLFIVFIISFSSLASIYYFVNKFINKRVSIHSEKIIVVKKGTSFSSLTEKLHSANIIKHPFYFLIYAKMHGLTTKIQAGEYQILPTMSPKDILDLLIKGKEHLFSITIPEGLTSTEIARLWEVHGFGSSEDFVRVLDKYETKIYQKPVTGWEGYLFPDTYFLPSNCPVEIFIESMISRFFKIFSDEWKEAGESHGLTLHQIVTLASLIEKETSLDSERPLVASVFYNRLKAGIPLQCDPTVIYALGDQYQGFLLKKHLKINSPYNTYIKVGLPPGPIANPGRKSLYAACYPANTQYFYFVADGKGGHVFSTNLNDHQKAVRHWRQSKKNLK